MRPARCPRLWQASAARDGRLDGAAVEGFEGHAQHCAACAAERCALAELGTQLRQAARGPDEVTLRRLRNSVLQRADALAIRPERSTWRVRGSVAAAVVCTLTLAGGLVRMRAVGPVARPSVVSIDASPGAQWAHTSTPSLEHLSLRDGTFGLSVHRGARDPRVVVQVPEGEIEDIGTRFRVTVREGRTEQVSVQQGSIVFRRPGAADLNLSTGSVWTAPARATVVVEADTEAPAREPAVRAALVQAHHPSRLHKKPAAVSLQGPPRASLRGDTSAEDLAYLRLIALLQEHRPQEARLAAADYLQKYPRAFRRIEVERIAHAPLEPTRGSAPAL